MRWPFLFLLMEENKNDKIFLVKIVKQLFLETANNKKIYSKTFVFYKKILHLRQS